MSDEERDVVEEPLDEGGAEAEEAADAEVEAKAEATVETRDEPEAAEPAGTELAPVSETRPSSNERIWAALAHASVLLTFVLAVSTGGLAVILGALVPLVIWLAFRDRSRFVAFHAMQASVFQFAAILAWVGLAIAGVIVLIPVWIVTILLLLVLIGLLLLPVALVLTVAVPAALVIMPLAVLVYGLYGAFEVYAGRDFRYWKVADWIERRGMKNPSAQLGLQPGSQ
jgi:hypothetical protein